MSLSENAKLAISITTGSVAMGVAYLVYLRTRTYSIEQSLVEAKPWPTQGSSEEKEALIDALLEEPCMLEAMFDPTRKSKFNSNETELLQDYRLLTISFIQRLAQSRTESKE